MLSNPYLTYHPTCSGVALQAVRQQAEVFRVWQIALWLSQQSVSLFKVISGQNSPRLSKVVKKTRNGAMGNWFILPAPHHNRTRPLGLVQQRQVIGMKCPAFSWQTLRSKSCTRNLWRISLDRNSGTLIRQGKRRIVSRSGKKITQARVEKTKQMIELDSSSIRAGCLVHISLCMWDESSGRRQQNTCVQTSCFTRNFALLFPDMQL